MGNPITSETLAEDSELKAGNPDKGSQKEASGASGFSGIEDATRISRNVEAELGGGMKNAQGKSLSDGADSMVGSGDDLIGCKESTFGTLVDEADPQTLTPGKMHLAADCKHAKEGLQCEVLKPDEGVAANVGVIGFEEGKIEENDALLLKTVDSAHKVEVFGDGLTLYVDFCGPPTVLVRNDVGCLELAPGETQGEKGVTEDGIQVIDNQDLNFSMGDIVWIKTKVESWWPGQIFDPRKAPNYAAERPKPECLLVRYIGNGNFSWASPSQLKPFIENFKQMTEEGKSRNFKAAVEKAVIETSKRVKLEMSCPCMLKERRTTISGELAASVRKQRQFEPAKFLSRLKFLSVEISELSMLEFTVLHGCLSAFYSSLGHSEMHMHLLQGTSDAENSSRTNLAQQTNNIYKVRCRDSQTDIDSSPCTPFSDTNKSANSVLLRRLSGVSEGEVSKINNLLNSSNGATEFVMETCRGDVAVDVDISTKMSPTSQDLDNFKNSKPGNDCDAFEGQNSCVLISSNQKATTPKSPSTESKESCLGTSAGDSVMKTEKGFESRERKKSKYLSPPYVNIGGGRKPVPLSGDSEAEDPIKVPKVSPEGSDVNQTDGQVSGSPSTIRCDCKKQKRWFRKSIDSFVNQGGANTLSADLLYELHSAALNCCYPEENMHFDSIKRFFSIFRSSTFRDSCYCEMCGKLVFDESSDLASEEDNSVHPGKSKPKKKKSKAMSTLIDLKVDFAVNASEVTANDKPYPPGKASRVSDAENLATLIVGMRGINGISGSSGTLVKDGKSYTLSKSKTRQKSRKKRDQENIMGSTSITSYGFLNVGGDAGITSTVVNDFQGSILAFDNLPLESKRNKKDLSTLNQLQTNTMDGLPDLNGNADIVGSVVEGTEFMGFVAPNGKLVPKKRKKSNEENPVGGPTADLPAKNNANSVQVTWDTTMLNNGERNVGTPYGLNPELTSALPDTEGTANPGSLVTNPSGISIFPSAGKPEVKRRKRKPKTTPGDVQTAGIPDLNGKGDELSPLEPEMNCLYPDTNPGARKRKRKGEAISKHPRKKCSEIPYISTNLNQVATNGEALGTALLLAFALDFPMPSAEALTGTFCPFGPLIESETQVFKESASAQVVFVNSSDAGDAFRSLEKNSPFGLGLLNYRLHNHSGASRALEPVKDIPVPLKLQPKEGLVNVITAKPSSLNPQLGEAPSLASVRKNLEMMTSTLEKSGKNLSPEMRAKLEGEIKGLLKKVSTMASSSSS